MAEITYANTWVMVCNRALSRLGAGSISTMTEGSDESTICVLHLGEAVGSLIEGYDWNCLKERVQLAALSTTPVYGYDYQYQFPVDHARTIEINADGNEYSVEGNKVLTDSDEVYLTYIKYPTDNPTSLPESLLIAIAAKLAVLICTGTTSKVSLQERLHKDATEARKWAIVQDTRNTYDNIGENERGYKYSEENR